MPVVLAKDGESLAGLSSLQLWPSLLMLLAEGGESLVALQARSKSGERSSCASNWTDTLTLPEKFVVIQSIFVRFLAQPELFTRPIAIMFCSFLF